MFAGNFRRRQSRVQTLGYNLAFLFQAPSAPRVARDDLDRRTASAPRTTRRSGRIGLAGRGDVVHGRLASYCRHAPPCVAAAPLTSQPRLPRLVSEPPRPQHSDVCLSSDARRSLMAAASSRRPILLVGEPDRCRSVVSCMPGLLPDLMLRESLEASMIQGLAGLLANGSLLRRPPFRVVDASATGAALFGDELRSYPGEIILAHHGVLVLEGLGAFSGATVLKILQALRGRAVSVHRSGSDATFPALFRLVATSTLEEVGRLTTFSDTDFLTEFDIICRAGQKGSRAVFR